MTVPVKTESNRHQSLQEKLNQMLKQSTPCDVMDRMQQLALMVLDLKPGDLAAIMHSSKRGH